MYLGSQHSSVGRSLITIGLDLHAASDTCDSFTTRQIGDMHESVVETGIDVSDAEYVLAIAHLWAEGDLDLLFLNFSLPGSHCVAFKSRSATVGEEAGTTVQQNVSLFFVFLPHAHGGLAHTHTHIHTHTQKQNKKNGATVQCILTLLTKQKHGKYVEIPN